MKLESRHIPKTQEEAELRAKIMMAFVLDVQIKQATAMKEKLQHEIDYLQYQIGQVKPNDKQT